MNECKYGFADPADLPEIQALLTRCDLPTEGLEPVLDHCLVVRSAGKLVGTVALESHQQFGLLRSLAVSPDHRGQGVGKGLCEKIVSHARLQQVETLYLLTTGAEGFFTTRGFKPVLRNSVPAAIQASAQFSRICPSAAVCMTRSIGNEVIHASTELLRLRPDVPGARMWAVSLERTMLTYFEVAAQSRFETHCHESEQITMVLSGELHFQVGRAAHCIKPGEVIAIPSSIPHAVWTEALSVAAIDAWSPVMKKYH